MVVALRVLVTGARGFVGQNVVRALLGASFISSVTEMIMEHEAESGVVIAPISERRKLSSPLVCDLTDPLCRPVLSEAMRNHDAIVHTAGAVGARSWNDCISVNVEGTRLLVDACCEPGSTVKTFVHMSSVSVYGRVPNIKIDENTPMIRIGDPYGDTKIAAEEIVRSRLSGLDNLVILRPTVVYGPGDNNFFPSLMKNVLAGKKFRIVGSGTQRVDLVHVTDVARLVLAVLDYDGRPSDNPRVFNVSDSSCPSWNEFARFVCARLFQPVPDRHIPFAVAFFVAFVLENVLKSPKLTRYSVRIIGRPYDYSSEKAYRELGWNPRVPLLEGIAKEIELRAPVSDGVQKSHGLAVPLKIGVLAVVIVVIAHFLYKQN